MHFVKWIFFNSCGIQISSFLTFLQSLEQLHDDPIRLSLFRRRILSFSLCLSLSSLALGMWRVCISCSSDVWMCYTMCSLWCVIRRDDWLRIYSICSIAARAAEILKEKRESQCVLVCAFLCMISRSQLKSSWVKLIWKKCIIHLLVSCFYKLGAYVLTKLRAFCL